MLFTRSKQHAFPPEFQIGSMKVLEEKDAQKILGVTVQNYLRWTMHVEDMVRKATRSTWVLRRMRALGVDQDTLVAFWKAEGRVHLELACPVWHSGLSVAQAQDLDQAHGGHSGPVGALPHPPDGRVGLGATWAAQGGHL